jgi:hypothetical protein
MTRSRRSIRNIFDLDLQIREILIVLKKERLLMIFLNLLDLQSIKIIVDFKKEVLIKNLMRKIRKKNVKEKKVEIILFILMMKALRKPKFLFQIGIQV